MRPPFCLLLCAALTAGFLPTCPAPAEEDATPAIESRSPDGRFAFRYATESDSEAKTYDLIATPSGKVLAHVAKSNDEIGSSARFFMKVLWRPDSKAFALTATLWKRGSELSVYRRDGATFREVKLPELSADIPEKQKKGKHFPHIMELDSHRAVRWQKDGSLVMEVENIQDGEDGTFTAKRTAVLQFTPEGKARVVKSSIRFTIETQ